MGTLDLSPGAALLQALGKEEAPFLSWFIPELTKMTGFSPINCATARSLAWSESE